MNSRGLKLVVSLEVQQIPSLELQQWNVVENKLPWVVPHVKRQLAQESTSSKRSSEEESEEENEEMTYLFKNFTRPNVPRRRGIPNMIALDPIKRGSSSKKACVATWSDVDSTEEDEVAHLFFMALQEDEPRKWEEFKSELIEILSGKAKVVDVELG
ncbi:hypothetical protein GQ457_05G020120 [Hibiscus cannabinus]